MKKEVFALLQSLQQWSFPKRYFKVGDEVFVQDDSIRDKWLMAKVYYDLS